MQNKNDLGQITILVGEKRAVTIAGKEYFVSASPMGEIPDIIEKIQQFEAESGVSDGKLSSKLVDKMIEIMLMGVKKNHPDITTKFIKENWPLAAFPVIVRIMLDLNDFLAGMGELQAPLQIISGLAAGTQAENVTKR